MNILRDVIFDLNAAQAYGKAVVPNLEALRELAIQRCREEAARATLYIADCLDLLTMFDEHEPDPAEVADRLSPANTGNWRSALQKAAEIATEAALVADVERDLGILNEAIQEILAANYEVGGIFATIPFGHLPHKTEEAWKTGTIYQWPKLTGACLQVSLPACVPLWIRLVEIQ